VRVLIDVANGRISEELLAILVRAGYTVERGTAHVAAKRFDVVVVGSVDAAERLRRDHAAASVIVFTRTGDVEARICALEAGAQDAVDAGFPMSQIAARVGAAGRRAALVPRPPERIEIDGCTIDLPRSSLEDSAVASSTSPLHRAGPAGPAHGLVPIAETSRSV